MEKSRVVERALAVLLAALPPVAVHGQSRMVGQVTDNTGGALPGVTVEASSPALIEGRRVAATDGQGRYGIVDLRPGTYEVTFTLAGFSTVVRDGLALPSDFAMTIDVQMLVGALEETVTVTGEAPIVDVQQAQRTQVIPREVIDAVPTGRSWQTRVALMPGVRTSLDIGGSHAMDQHAVRTAGLADNNTTVLIDGMQLNNLSSDGASQYYLNDAFTHEMAVQTSGPDAETSAGGVRVSLIPREGGNELSGTFYHEAMNRDFTWSNLTPRLRDQGVASVDRIDRAYEVNGSLGGPVARDRVWFFYSGHRRIRDRVVLDSFYRDGSPGIDDRQVHGNNLRLTIQGTARDKLSVWFDRNNKVAGHNHSAGEDVETASMSRGLGRHPPPATPGRRSGRRRSAPGSSRRLAGRPIASITSTDLSPGCGRTGRPTCEAASRRPVWRSTPPRPSPSIPGIRSCRASIPNRPASNASATRSWTSPRPPSGTCCRPGCPT